MLGREFYLFMKSPWLKIGPYVWSIKSDNAEITAIARPTLSQFWSFKIRRMTFSEVHRIHSSTDYEAFKKRKGQWSVGELILAFQTTSSIWD